MSKKSLFNGYFLWTSVGYGLGESSAFGTVKVIFFFLFSFI